MKIKTHAPGVYFGMPEKEYHADPSFSSSVAKSMLVSPLTCWCQHYDPDREETNDSAARLKGKATHTAILEGWDAFSARYAIEQDPAEHPEYLKGAAALKARCKELGVSAGGTIAEMCRRIVTEDPHALLWPEVEAEFEANLCGRTRLSPAVGQYVIRTGRLVERNPSVRKAVKGGFPEVSIFWHDADIPWKARIDYLKIRTAIDMKTFTNMYDKPLSVAVAHAVAQHRYHVQAKIYMDALRAAASLPARGDAVPPEDWLVRWRAAMAQNPRFIFLFVESGNVPNVALREFKRIGADGQETLAYQSAAAAVDAAAMQWTYQVNKFGIDEPWIEDTPMMAFADAEFPLYMTE